MTKATNRRRGYPRDSAGGRTWLTGEYLAMKYAVSRRRQDGPGCSYKLAAEASDQGICCRPRTGTMGLKESENDATRDSRDTSFEALRRCLHPIRRVGDAETGRCAAWSCGLLVMSKTS